MSKTQNNLKAAFAGESQARNKYIYFAKAAKKEGYHYIAKLFLETAEEEDDKDAAFLFRHIAGIEAHHRDRYKKLLEIVKTTQSINVKSQSNGNALYAITSIQDKNRRQNAPAVNILGNITNRQIWIFRG